MAGRGGVGVGVVITIAVLGVASLAFFVTTIVFFGNLRKAESALANAEQGLSEYVTAQERLDAGILASGAAARESRQSVVGYYHQSLTQAMSMISGQGRGTYASMLERLDQVRLPEIAGATGWRGADASQAPSLRELASPSLSDLLRKTNDFVASLRGQLSAAEAAKTAAENDLRNALDVIERERTQHRTTLGAVNEQLEQYRAEVDAYRSGVDQAKTDMNATVDRTRSEASSREKELQGRIVSLEEEAARLRNQVDELRGARKEDLLQGRPEESLVDGAVIAVDPADGTATIDRGRAHKVRVGLTFAVYAEAAGVRPDENGEYPRGKAALEVIRVDETSARCRVLSERAGNPVVRGDAIANAVYDPSKVYAMLVIGNFDTDRDGAATEAEQAGVRAMIEGWGGIVADELTGHVDFLIAGQRPVLPPEPGIGSPIELVQAYLAQQALQQRYDRLFEQAAATSIPVLNENRLRTLIGEP